MCRHPIDTDLIDKRQLLEKHLATYQKIQTYYDSVSKQAKQTRDELTRESLLPGRLSGHTGKEIWRDLKIQLDALSEKMSDKDKAFERIEDAVAHARADMAALTRYFDQCEVLAEL